MTTPEPMPDAIAKRVAEIKSEFDRGGYFSDPAHTEKAEQLLDALADQLRAALVGHPEPVAGQHRAEAWRVGDRLGWSCIDCTSKAEDVIDATAAERGAEWHSLHPHGLAAHGPVTDATQDRGMIAAKAIADHYGHGTRRYEEDGRLVVAALDAADAAAGIRRVRLDEAIERAAKAGYEQYPAVGAGWETNPASRKPWAEVPAENQRPPCGLR